MATTPNFIQSDDSGCVSLTTSFQSIMVGASAGSFVMMWLTSPSVALATVTIANEVPTGSSDDPANTLGKISVPTNTGNSSSLDAFVPPINVGQLIAGAYMDGKQNIGVWLNDATKGIKAKSSLAGVLLHWRKLNFGGSAPRFYASTVQAKYDLVTGSYSMLVSGGANGSFISAIHLVNENATENVVRFADENDNLLGSVIVPGNAGNTVERRPVAVPFWISGLEFDQYGNPGIRLKDATKSIKVLQTAETDIVVHYVINHY